MLGARAAYIGGCNSTACTISDEVFGVPSGGTMAHSWVQMFDDEYTAFKTYCEIYPENPTLLVDTYNVIESGIPNAIKVFRELGITKCGIRIDSGDVTYLTKKARKMLVDAGFEDCKIIISNSLDEYIIRELIRQGAEVDAFGIGERLITAKSDPVFGGVYKLCAVENDAGEIVPKIKISENVGKITTPHFKKIYRLRGRDTGKAEADLICLYDEVIDDTQPLEIFDPEHTWKRKRLDNFKAEELLVPIFKDGKQVYELPSIHDVRAHCACEIEGVWEEVRRFSNPHNYYVDLSEKLWNIKHDMLKSRR
jgi:nicotinate phosphoribosyltransferase